MSAVLQPAHAIEPDPWLAQAIDPYRACARCDHGRLDFTGERCCTHPSAALAGHMVRVDRPRSRYGACGINADLMDAPFLR